MLHFSAVRPQSALVILKSLMKLDVLEVFFLVGGTALALQLGHRISVDLDLFSQKEFDCEGILRALPEEYKYSIVKKQDRNLMILHLSTSECPDFSVKVEFLRYPHPLIDEVIQTDGLRILSVKDIIPMKLSAISGRGAKKDFYDIYHLLDDYSLPQMMEFFSQKYPNITHFQVIKSLLYFVDAENDLDPFSLKKVFWEDVKNRIRTVVHDYLS